MTSSRLWAWTNMVKLAMAKPMPIAKSRMVLSIRFDMSAFYLTQSEYSHISWPYAPPDYTMVQAARTTRYPS